MREAFERALSRVGVHPILGGAVWGALLRFEKEELEDAQETGADAAEVSKAQDRCVRQLLWVCVLCPPSLYFSSSTHPRTLVVFL